MVLRCLGTDPPLAGLRLPLLLLQCVYSPDAGKWHDVKKMVFRPGQMSGAEARGYRVASVISWYSRASPDYEGMDLAL